MGHNSKGEEGGDIDGEMHDDMATNLRSSPAPTFMVNRQLQIVTWSVGMIDVSRCEGGGGGEGTGEDEGSSSVFAIGSAASPLHCTHRPALIHHKHSVDPNPRTPVSDLPFASVEARKLFLSFLSKASSSHQSNSTESVELRVWCAALQVAIAPTRPTRPTCRTHPTYKYTDAPPEGR